MEPSSRSWTRRLAVAVALVVTLFAVAPPASAAPSTKNYSATLTGGANGGQVVTVPIGTTPNTVALVLTNRLDSQQSFGSAQLDFTGSPLPTAVSAPGWTTQKLSLTGGVRFRVISAPSGGAVPPGGSKTVTITLPATKAGTTEVTTQVKQSNDFKGTNNDFTLVPPPTQPLTINTVGTCAGTCSPTTDPSPINKVTANLTITASAPFTFVAGFTLDRLSCDEIPFGPTVTPEPFLVDTTSSAPLSKTLVLTFPKALSVLVPDNGTPHHPVCAGGDAPFPGGSSVGAITHPFEGLLLNCDDPAYLSAIAALQASGNPFLPMCVSARARSAGKLVITIQVQTTTFDPRFW